MIKITIDDREYEAEKDMSVLEVARTNQIPIPTLCFHPSLKPSGACQLCAATIIQLIINAGACPSLRRHGCNARIPNARV